MKKAAPIILKEDVKSKSVVYGIGMSYTWKNVCQSFSKGNDPGVKNIKATLGTVL